ncbi:hypothetical protein PQX77_013610 [Marasmius sp. AFHP31]|nr:hypothetical protein PQX77_013610 [Marasmius sp. AFHP31]
MSNFFRQARHIYVDGNPRFQHVEGDLVTQVIHFGDGSGSSSYHQQRDVEQIMPIQDQYAKILRGDIVLQEEIGSESIKMVVRQPFKPTNPFHSWVPARTATINVQKRVFKAELIHLNGRAFTVITFEPENQDKETKRTICTRVYNASARHTSPLLTQLFALAQADMPMFILHDELVDSQRFSDHYMGNSIVFQYLQHTIWASMTALRDDKALSIPVSFDLWTNDWMFNLKSQSWQYNVPSVSISPPTIVEYD